MKKISMDANRFGRNPPRPAGIGPALIALDPRPQTEPPVRDDP